MSNSKSAWYRPDIDGLRALAVLAVIFYHFDFTWFPGGFTGVDVFFVISGYLIIGIIHRELKEGTFSLVNFWERRVRRIVPAAFVILMAVTIASYHYLTLPNDYRDFGQTLMAQSVFASNLWFMAESEYFAEPNDTIPLLHTWSLAVEEQFYLFFPLLVILLYPYVRRQFGLVLVGLAALSFAYGVWLTNMTPTVQFSIPFVPHLWGSATNSSAAFYFFAARFWELLVGGVIAVYALRIKNSAVAELTAIAGLASVLAGIFVLTETDPFPGYAALLPVLGTAAIIAANTGNKTLVFKLLSVPTVVMIGLISYSLYLWHWPILVFAKYLLPQDQVLPGGTTFFLLVIVFILSFLTYKYVETPVRKRKVLADRNKLFLAGFGALALLFVTGYFVSSQNGFPERATKQGQLIAAAIDDFNPRKEECFTKSTLRFKFNEEPCLLGEQNPDKIDFVLWGDSQANAAMPAFDEYGMETGKTGIFFAATICPPLITERPITKNQQCVDENEKAIAYIEEYKPETVYIVTEWRKGYRYFDVEDDGSPLTPLLRNTLEQLPQDIEIVLFQRLQAYSNYNFRDIFFQVESGEFQMETTFTRKAYDSALEPYNSQVNAAVKGFDHVTVLDPATTFCNEEMCQIGDEGGLYYHDSSHLSVYGTHKTILPLLLAYDASRSSTTDSGE